MAKISKSLQRGKFQKEKYLERQSEKGKTPENDEDTRAMVEFYESFEVSTKQREADPEWRKNNLEWDLRTTDWILEKVRNNRSYSQNLYAAMCNNSFQKLDVMPILKDQKWSCSWRYAGGIIADMRQEGDYIDWYCSGIRDTTHPSALEWQDWTKEQQEYFTNVSSKFVGESVVTDEIIEDLKRLGWIVVQDDE